MLRTFAIASAGAFLMAACATTEEDASERNPYIGDARLGEQVDRICFGSQINGFGQTTDNTVIVEAGVRKHYLIETVGFCPNLDFAQSLAFDRFGSCLTWGDSVIAFDTVFPSDGRGGLASRKCPIKAIYAWDPDAAEDENGEESEDGGEETETAEG